MSKLLTINELAGDLRVKLSWVRSMIFRKEIPFIKIGRHIRFEEEAIKKWICTHQVNSPRGES